MLACATCGKEYNPVMQSHFCPHDFLISPDRPTVIPMQPKPAVKRFLRIVFNTHEAAIDIELDDKFDMQAWVGSMRAAGYILTPGFYVDNSQIQSLFIWTEDKKPAGFKGGDNVVTLNRDPPA